MDEAKRGDEHGNSRCLEEPGLAATGITGLDKILGGGLPRDYSYLIQGPHGSGKTTLALRFCITGAAKGERVLFLTTCENDREIHQIARSHNWSLDGVEVHYHDARESLGLGAEQSVFHAGEIELPQTMNMLLSVIEEFNPERLVIDSLSEIRLLAADPRWFRQQVLSLKEDLMKRRCTTLFCDEGVTSDQPVRSVVHGVVELRQESPDYGSDRRRLRISKIRGREYISGYHDMKIRKGGLEVFPRLVAARHRDPVKAETVSSGLPELDTMLGDGGFDRGTATLLLGPSGTGKSVMASQVVESFASRGERAAMYIFDERIQTLLLRARGLGLDLEKWLDKGILEIQQNDPAEFTPGELSQMIVNAVIERNVKLIVIDSLAGYIYAMPEENSLTLHLHELLSVLNQHGVTTLMVLTEHGPSSTPSHVRLDLSYLADSVLRFHSFEYDGEIRNAISVFKRRTGDHERALRELRFGSQGLNIGKVLRGFRGILSGTVEYRVGELPDAESVDRI